MSMFKWVFWILIAMVIAIMFGFVTETLMFAAIVFRLIVLYAVIYCCVKIFRRSRKAAA